MQFESNFERNSFSRYGKFLLSVFELKKNTINIIICFTIKRMLLPKKSKRYLFWRHFNL